MKRKKLSAKNQLAVAAYEAAAERIGEGLNFYACCAIDGAGGRLTEFRDWFRPGVTDPESCGWWPGSTLIQFPEHQLPERTMRILALLLMAELVRDGQIDFDAP